MLPVMRLSLVQRGVSPDSCSGARCAQKRTAEPPLEPCRALHDSWCGQGEIRPAGCKTPPSLGPRIFGRLRACRKKGRARRLAGGAVGPAWPDQSGIAHAHASSRETLAGINTPLILLILGASKSKAKMKSTCRFVYLRCIKDLNKCRPERF